MLVKSSMGLVKLPNLLNEKIVTVKRKYTDAHPAHIHSTYGPVREKVLSFINKYGSVSHQELKEFLNQYKESSGRTTGFGWIRKNNHLVEKITKKNSGPFYRLTKRGKKVLEKIHNLVENRENFTNTEKILDKNIYYCIMNNILEHEVLTEEELSDLFKFVSRKFNVDLRNYNDIIQNSFKDKLIIEVNNNGELEYHLNENGEEETLNYLFESAVEKLNVFYKKGVIFAQSLKRK